MPVLVVFATFWALAASAFCDGTYFGKRTVEARPTIPYQRAVLKFDGQEQIMLVESTLKGPEGIYGWVIPLPKKPTYLKPVNPAYVASSFDSVKPPILSERHLPVTVFLLALGYAALVLTSGARHRKKGVATRVLYFAAESLVPLLLAAYFWPTIVRGSLDDAVASAGGTESAKGSVRVDDYGTVGSYQVSVVSGVDGKPILEWLKARDLAVGEDALPVIDAYVKEGWCFMAAEVRKKERGAYPPHPIKAVFPSDRLVYPMRLTGLQIEPLRLELLVISDKEASIPGLEAWSCDNRAINVFIDQSSAQDEELFADWKSGAYAMAKAGMVSTYLRGDLKPDRMKDDFEFDWRPMTRFRAEVYDAETATNKAQGKFALALAVASLVIGFVLVCWAALSVRMLAIGSAVAFVVAATYAVYWRSTVHVLETEEIPIEQGRH